METTDTNKIRTKKEFTKKVVEFKRIFGFNPPVDKLLLTKNSWHIDLIQLDTLLNKCIPDYDMEKCTYKGVPDYSMAMVVEEAFGKRACDLIMEMI